MIFLFGCRPSSPGDADVRPGVEESVERADSLINTGDYVHALDTLLSVCHEIDSRTDIADTTAMRTYFLMGKVHSIFDDSRAAISFYNKGLGLRTQSSNPEVVMKLYGNLYQAYAAGGEFQQAKRANDSLYGVRINPDDMKQFLYNFNLADLSERRGRHEEAIRYYQKSLECIDGEVVKESMKVYPYSEMATVYMNSGENDSAYVYLKKFENAAEADGEPYVKASALRELMFWSAKNDRPLLAAEYMERYFAFTDSLIDIRAFLKSKENIRQYEEQTSNGIISDMTESISKGHRVIFNLVLLILFVGIIAGFALWRAIMVRRNNQFLFAKNEELTKIESKYRELLIETSQQQASKSEAKTMTESEATKELMEKIMVKMECDKPYLDPEFSLQSLAELVGSNTKYVSQAINEISGQNFRNFINEFRIKEAERRLTDKENYGQYTIQWIAESVGIKSKSTFVTAFKRVTGLTPGVYVKLSNNQTIK